MTGAEWTVLNPGGRWRVIVTKELPGCRWRELLLEADCRMEISRDAEPLTEHDLIALIGSRCDAVIGQLTEPWTERVLGALAGAGGRILSAYAVGYDNVNIAAASRLGVAVGNTPGVLTETTAEMAVALTFAAARRIPEGDKCMREAAFRGWLPSLLLGKLLWRKTLGVIGAGRIGTAYARMMVFGHQMDLFYYSSSSNTQLERDLAAYSALLTERGQAPVICRRAASLAELLHAADVVSLHVPLNAATRHLIGADELATMKDTAILVNTSRGPVVDEAALIDHCRTYRSFRAGLDVYEDEPVMKPGLSELDNVVLAPHLGSATGWTREGMATLAAMNVTAVLNGWPVWGRAVSRDDVLPFLGAFPPAAAPSIVNAGQLGLRRVQT